MCQHFICHPPNTQYQHIPVAHTRQKPLEPPSCSAGTTPVPDPPALNLSRAQSQQIGEVGVPNAEQSGLLSSVIHRLALTPVAKSVSSSASNPPPKRDWHVCMYVCV